MAEFLPPRSRGRWLVILEGFWAVGTLAVALVAWGLSLGAAAEAWRWIFLATALLGIPTLLLIVLQWGREHRERNNAAPAASEAPK